MNILEILYLPCDVAGCNILQLVFTRDTTRIQNGVISIFKGHNYDVIVMS